MDRVCEGLDVQAYKDRKVCIEVYKKQRDEILERERGLSLWDKLEEWWNGK